jgi:ubiquinone/menaquinone biosynthesis C-methylase UbiE
MDNASVKAYKGIGMEGLIAKWYAANTRKGMEEYKTLAREVANELSPDSRVLELAPGPGYFAIELAKLGRYRITGLDISQTFVEMARKNATKERVRVDFQQGNAASTPFADETFDFILCRAAFKNFAEPVRALQEMRRALRPGGRALIIDLRRDAGQHSINQYVDNLSLNWLSTAMTKLIFRFMLLKRAYTKGEFQQFFSQANFRTVDIRDSLIGLEMWLEK